MAEIKITLVKSTIGAIPKHKRTVQALGLNKTNSSVIQQDNAAIRGMLQQPAEAIKVPVSVPVQAANAALKAARCLCTEDFLREASHAETAKKLLQSTFPC